MLGSWFRSALIFSGLLVVACSSQPPAAPGASMLDNPQSTFELSAAPNALPGVRVNQVGYLPNSTKRAIIVDPSPSPLSWELRNSAASAVATGVTSVFGHDAASGDHVH